MVTLIFADARWPSLAWPVPCRLPRPMARRWPGKGPGACHAGRHDRIVALPSARCLGEPGAGTSPRGIRGGRGGMGVALADERLEGGAVAGVDTHADTRWPCVLGELGGSPRRRGSRRPPGATPSPRRRSAARARAPRSVPGGRARTTPGSPASPWPGGSRRPGCPGRSATARGGPARAGATRGTPGARPEAPPRAR